jgi:hypothetical protein
LGQKGEIEKEYLFKNPSASKEKVNGAVFRLLYENMKEKHDYVLINSSAKLSFQTANQ